MRPLSSSYSRHVIVVPDAASMKAAASGRDAAWLRTTVASVASRGQPVSP